MSDDVSEEAVFLEAAWRFAFVLTGCREGASKAFKESVDELLRHPHAGDLEKTEKLLFAAVRRRSLKFPAYCELKGSPARLHRLPEPGRSALALLSLNALGADAITNILGIDSRGLAEALGKARSALREGAVSAK